MNTEVAVQNIQSRLPMPSGMQDIDAGKWRVLCESVFPNAKSSDSIVMAIDYCKARKLDPFKRPVNIVPMWNSSLQREVETVWPGINEVQVTASRTGKYAGMDYPKWGPDITQNFKGVRKYKEGTTWKEENIDITVVYPEWCSVTVYRIVEGQRCAFTEPVYWLEAYAKAGKTDCPNAMWAKRPRGQVLKVAKAFSLRAAFPEEGEYTAEEMEGKEIAAGGIVIEQDSPKNITPSDTDHSKPQSPFKKAVDRNTYCRNVKESIQRADTTDVLEDIKQMNKSRFEEMELSGSEADQLGLDDLRQAFKLQWNSIIRNRGNAVTDVEPEDEISSFAKQQMEEEKEFMAAKGIDY